MKTEVQLWLWAALSIQGGRCNLFSTLAWPWVPLRMSQGSGERGLIGARLLDSRGGVVPVDRGLRACGFFCLTFGLSLETLLACFQEDWLKVTCLPSLDTRVGLLGLSLSPRS